jgi:hypothetical protein
MLRTTVVCILSSLLLPLLLYHIPLTTIVILGGVEIRRSKAVGQSHRFHGSIAEQVEAETVARVWILLAKTWNDASTVGPSESMDESRRR